MRRLTVSQYQNAVRDLLGGGELFVPDQLEPDVRLRGFIAVGAGVTSISPRGVEQYEQAAYILAEQAMEPDRRDALLPCTPSGTVDSECSLAFVQDFGRRAWRRPLTDDEAESIAAIADTAAGTLGDFHDGLEFAVATLLQSPNFLFLVELGEDNPETGGRRFTDWEMAARLSFLLWNTIPDAELLDAAEQGELTTDDGLVVQVARLMDDDRARRGLRAFVSDLLHLDKLDDLNKDPNVFVYMTDTLGPSAREETLMGWEYLVFDADEDVRQIANTRRAFLNRELAALYNVPAPMRDGFGETMLPEDVPRRGALGQASFLALHSHPVSSSAVLRGKFIRQALLCLPMPDPPSGVDTSIPEPSPDAPTLRDRVAIHLENPDCAFCHRTMDPIGLGLENFDGLGRYRTHENDVLIDASGELDGTPFTNPEELADAIYKHEDFVPCMVKNLFRYSAGHFDHPGERPAINWLTDEFSMDGHRLASLWEEMVLNPVFRETGAVE